jgi:MBG domain (YGX type)/YDG domain
MRWLQLLAVLVVVSVFACDNNSNDLLAPATPKGPLYAMGSDPVTGATIETDQDDYLPGEIIHLVGSGWAANETVHLDMTEDPDTHGDVAQDVQADSAGAFNIRFYDVQEHDLGVQFTLTGTGNTSGSVVTVRFTDGRAIATLTLNGAAAVTVASAASISANATGALTGNNNNTLASIGIKAFVHGANANTAVQLTCSDVSPNLGPAAPSNPIPFSHTFSFNAPSTGAVYDVIVTSYEDDACAVSNGASSMTLANGITVQSQANQTISFGPLANKTFGNAAFSVSATASSGLPVSFSSQTPATCDVSGNTVTILHAGACTVRASQTGNASFNPAADVDQSFTIARADANIVVTGYSGTYDGSAHAATGSATGVNGENLSGLLSLGVSFTDAPGGNAFWTFAGTADYNGAGGAVAITINQASASITVSGYTGMYDGLAHGATGSATGVNGENLNTLLNLGASFTNVPGGNATWAFAGNTNYSAAGGSVSITITKATAVLSVDGFSGQYDGIAHGATGSATGVTGEDLNSLFLSLGATFTHVPGGTAHWTFAGNQNYRDSSGTVSIVIAPLAVTATIAAADKVYNGGDAATITDCTLQGALAGDDVSCSASGASFANANAGSNKTVTATVALSGTASGDYTLGVNTTVTTMASISQKSVTATIIAADKTYDGTESAEITTCTVNGKVGSDDVHCSTSSAAFSSAGAGDDKPVGATVSLSGSASGNYTLDDNTTAATTATIHKAPLTVTADDQQKTYDGAGYSPFTATFTGFVNGEGVSELSGSPDVGGNAVGAVNAGSYTITPYQGSLSAANYTFATFNSGTLTIDKAPLTVTADNKAKVFDGTPYSPFTVTFSGFVNGEPASVVTGAAGFTGAAVGAMMPGSYAITPTAGTLTATNYAFTTFHNGTLTIISWTLTGFYQPVDMPNPLPIWNTVKGGSTVPLKFEIFAGSVERSDVGSVKSFTQAKVACDATAPTDDLEFTTTGGTSLRYDATAGQFIQNWQTPKLAGQCYMVTMTTQDNSKLVAFFKLK